MTQQNEVSKRILSDNEERLKSSQEEIKSKQPIHLMDGISGPFNAFQILPEVMGKALELFDSERDKDFYLLGAIEVLNELMPVFFSKKRSKKIHPKLYFFVLSILGSSKYAVNNGYNISKRLYEILLKEKSK